MWNGKNFPITDVFFSLIIVLLINDITAINYSNRQDEIPKNVTQADARTTRQILELTTKIKKLKKKYSLQEGTEHLLQFGALLRTQILDTFGFLVYDRYDDFSITQMEALYRIYHETLERKYNIFDIVPNILKTADIKPSKVCRYINENIHTCLKESSQLCMNIRKHNQRRLINLNYTPQIYQLAKIQQHFPDGFSLKIILHHLQNNSLKFTPSLLSGLLHNVQYDSFDDEVRTAERELIRYLIRTSRISKHSILMTSEEIQNQRTVSGLLKTYLKNALTEFKSPANFHAEILAEHVVREVEAISENIELLGIAYENNTINLKYLFDLILPADVIDKDLIEAKEYLLRKTHELQVVSKYLRIEKYQQAGPDQLLMEILGQMRDIHFAVDIVSALHTHAKFWHRSRTIVDTNELLELFSSYENLRKVEEYKGMMKVIDQIKNRLSESKNVSIEISCSNPRACLQIGLQVVLKCIYVDEGTKNLIKKFFDKVTSKGSPTKEECPSMKTTTTESEEFSDTTEEPKTEFSTTTKDVSSEDEESKTLAFFDNSEPSPETSVPLTTKALEEVSTTEISAEAMEIETEVPIELSIETTSTRKPKTEKISTTTEEVTTTEKISTTTDEVTATEKVTTNEEVTITEAVTTNEEITITEKTTKSPEEVTTKTEKVKLKKSEEIPTTTEKVTKTTEEVTTATEAPTTTEKISPTTEEISKTTKKIPTTIEKVTTTTEFTTIKNTEKNPTTTDSSTSECSSSEECSSECIGENCSSSKEDCSTDDCKTENPCKGDECKTENCSGQNCTTTECEGSNCPSIECKGKDCSTPKENTTCDGENCSQEKEETSPCKGKDCHNEEETDCKGSDCPKEGKDDCKDSNCLDNEKETDCKGSGCPDKETEPPCRGTECPGSDCKGKNCPPDSREKCSGNNCPESPTNKTTFLCNNKDPHRQRKKERLQKMHQLDVFFLTTSKYKDIDSEDTTLNDDYSSIDEAKATWVDEEQTAKGPQTEKHPLVSKNNRKTKIKVLRGDKKKHTRRHDMEKGNEKVKKVKTDLEKMKLKLNEDYSSIDGAKATGVNENQPEKEPQKHLLLTKVKRKSKMQTDKQKDKKIMKKQSKHSHFTERNSELDLDKSPEKVYSDNFDIGKKEKRIKEKKNSKKKSKDQEIRVTESNQEQNTEVNELNHDKNKGVTKPNPLDKILDPFSNNSNKGKKKNSLDQKERKTSRKNFNLNLNPEKEKETNQMEKIKENKLAKIRLEENEDWLNSKSKKEDVLINEDLGKEEEELKNKDLSKNEDEFKNYDLSKNADSLKNDDLSKSEDLLRTPYEYNQAKNSYRRSNYPIDSEDVPFVYQTPKPELKTVERSYFEDLLNKYDNERPENRMFAEPTYNKGSDEIERKGEIFNPRRQKSNSPEDFPDNEEKYYDETDLLKSRKKWSPWYQ